MHGESPLPILKVCGDLGFVSTSEDAWMGGKSQPDCEGGENSVFQTHAEPQDRSTKRWRATAQNNSADAM